MHLPLDWVEDSEDEVERLRATKSLAPFLSQQNRDRKWKAEVQVQAEERSPIWRPPRLEPQGRSPRPESG